MIKLQMLFFTQVLLFTIDKQTQPRRITLKGGAHDESIHTQNTRNGECLRIGCLFASAKDPSASETDGAADISYP